MLFPVPLNLDAFFGMDWLAIANGAIIHFETPLRKVRIEGIILGVRMG